MAYFNLSNPADKERFNEYVERVIEKRGIVRIEDATEPRTLEQNSYFYFLVSCYATYFGYTNEYVKNEILKKHLCPDIFARAKRLTNGKTVLGYRSTGSLSTAEMSVCINRLMFDASQGGLYLPEANEYARIIDAYGEIRKCRDYVLQPKLRWESSRKGLKNN